MLDNILILIEMRKEIVNGVLFVGFIYCINYFINNIIIKTNEPINDDLIEQNDDLIEKKDDSCQKNKMDELRNKKEYLMELNNKLEHIKDILQNIKNDLNT